MASACDQFESESPASELRFSVRPTPSTRVLLDLLDQSKMAVAIFDSEGRCVHFSAAMAYMLQEKLDVCCQATIWEVAAWKAAGLLHDAVQTLADGESRSRIFETPGLERRSMATVHRVGDKKHMIAILATYVQNTIPPPGEVTIEDLRAFAEATAHRVNNGLVQASCALDMLADESEESPTAQMLIQQALGSIERVAQGVREAAETFLSSPRSESSMSFSEVVNEVMNTRTPGEFARIRMDYGKMQQLPSVFGSTIQIRKAVQQVLSNALEAQPDGMVTVDGCVIETEELRFLSSGEVVQPGSYLVLEISDEGPGLSDEVRQKATLPFYSTKLLGRGLGLATTAKIARDHGGGVDMSTNVGGKTTVRLWLALGPDCANPAR